MAGKRVSDGLCCSINRYATANNKYMKDYDEDKKSLYLKYSDVNNLCGSTISNHFACKSL